ncbi:MAG: restriction endonuclease subunit S [Lactobacillus paragasseri]|uniref:restriction endonuclease subunit S n=2 Tax=Lactobacillus paragasseri TaxID=2107999 RepID=UPI00189CE839|nr:restriction endonuclease subunit S [Lactobacillus paragasseri]MDU8979843.1 restriction endonuclease subunit S [Lactobacillus paragasseri]
MKYKLKEIGEIISGGTPSTKRSDFYATKGIGWITPKDLSNYHKKYICHGARDISKIGLDNSSAKIMPPNSILVSSRAPIGYVAMAEESLATNQGFKSIIPDVSKVLPDYLYYLMLNSKSKLEQVASGSTFKEVSGKTMANFEVDIPEIQKQKYIISLLNPIVKKIELNNQINDNLLELLKSEFNHSVIDNNKKIPINKIFSVQSGFAFKSNDWSITGKNVVKIKDIENNTVSLNNLSKVNNVIQLKKAKKYYVTGGEIVIALTGATLGKIGILPYNFEGYINQRVGLIYPKMSYTSVLGVLLQKEIRNKLISLGHGSAQPNLSPKAVNEMIVNIDIEACRKYDVAFSSLFKKVIYNLNENQVLTKLKMQLLDMYF